VYLKSAKWIEGLLATYFFALMAQSLLERKLRRAMWQKGVESSQLDPEGHALTRPTKRQVLAPFEPIAHHTIVTSGKDDFEILNTELALIHREIPKPLNIP